MALISSSLLIQSEFFNRKHKSDNNIQLYSHFFVVIYWYYTTITNYNSKSTVVVYRAKMMKIVSIQIIMDLTVHVLRLAWGRLGVAHGRVSPTPKLWLMLRFIMKNACL